jgi:hypothetical protein
MAKYCVVKIPTKPHLKKYIEHHLSPSLMIPGDHPVQKFLYIMLEKKFYRYDFKSFESGPCHELEFHISKYTFSHVGSTISRQNVMVINDYLQELFDRDLYSFCRDFEKYADFNEVAYMQFASFYSIPVKRSEAYMHKKNWLQKPSLKQILEQFASLYSIDLEKDISFDALKKMEYRVRKRLEKNQKNILLRCVPAINETSLSVSMIS